MNPDGGLKSFGHPIGASGLRMMYEMWLQLRGEAGQRQIANPRLGLDPQSGRRPRPLRQLRVSCGREWILGFVQHAVFGAVESGR